MAAVASLRWHNPGQVPRVSDVTGRYLSQATPRPPELYRFGDGGYGSIGVGRRQSRLTSAPLAATL